jgi:hypothetical protein
VRQSSKKYTHNPLELQRFVSPTLGGRNLQ